MPTLAQTLETTAPVSPLLRKARRLGIRTVEDMIHLAAARGCSHYQLDGTPPDVDVPATSLADDELVILLIVGENAYEPTAIRCAAQLARSSRIEPASLARLAIMEKCERVLSHIARAGAIHDPEGSSFWRDLLDRLPSGPARQETALPHWTRFVSMPGIQRSGIAPTRWLIPRQ
ncbi:MAG: hypothetical protein ACO3JG_13965 [Luteolibacter sp.]